VLRPPNGSSRCRRADLRRQGFKNSEVDNGSAWVAPGDAEGNDPRSSGWFKAALQEPEVKAKLALQGLYRSANVAGFSNYIASASMTTAR